MGDMATYRRWGGSESPTSKLIRPHRLAIVGTTRAVPVLTRTCVRMHASACTCIHCVHGPHGIIDYDAYARAVSDGQIPCSPGTLWLQPCTTSHGPGGFKLAACVGG